MTFRIVIGSLAVIGLFLSSGASAGISECDGTVTKLRLKDFLAAQGTDSTYFPPVPDFSFFGSPFPEEVNSCRDLDDVYLGLVDYAGLANAYIKDNGGKSLRTKVRGFVFQCDEEDVSYVSVTLFTRRALGFAQSVGSICDNDSFDLTPAIFGNKTEDVADGAKPALGWSTYKVRYTIEDPEERYQDLMDIDSIQEVRFHSVTFGKHADGTPSIMRIDQQAAAPDADDDLEWTSEIVDIIKLGGDKH